MSCEQFKEITGMQCNQLGSAVEILTPFTFADGNGIEIFAEIYGSQIHFFDDGFTLLHLHSAGIPIGGSKQKWRPLTSIANAYGVTLSEDGVFEIMCDSKNPGKGFAKIVSTLLGVAAWEREQAGVAMSSAWLVDEVALYLKAWKPNSKLIEQPSIKGFSGRILTFDFEQDGQYIDAVSPHFASIGSELRKIVDLNSSAGEVRKEMLVIVDDRQKPEAAKQEIKLLGRVAKAWPLTSLISAAGIPASIQ
jgi:hypothetical protein